MLQFKILGPLEVLDGDQPRTPTPPKVRRVLALLLLRANQVVPMDAIIEELWGEEPPLSAVGTAQPPIRPSDSAGLTGFEVSWPCRMLLT